MVAQAEERMVLVISLCECVVVSCRLYFDLFLLCRFIVKYQISAISNLKIRRLKRDFSSILKSKSKTNPRQTQHIKQPKNHH